MRVLVMLAGLGLLSGCVSYDKGVWSDAPPQFSTMQDATVVEVTRIEIQRPDNPIGTVTGAVAGMFTGALIGQATDSCIATVVASYAGMLIGSKLANRPQEALEIRVDPDAGGTGHPITITQKPDQTFAPGERVRIYALADGTMRVTKMPESTAGR